MSTTTQLRMNTKQHKHQPHQPKRTEEDVQAHLDVVAVLVLEGGHLAADPGARLVDVHLVALGAVMIEIKCT